MANTEALKEFVVAISRYGEERLSQEGFVLTSRYTHSRTFGPLTHLLCFQTGATSLKGSFTVNFGWRFDFDAYPRDRAEMDHWERIGIAAGGKDRWFSYETNLEQSITEVADLVDQHALPVLNRYKSVKAVIDDADARGRRVAIPLVLGLAYAHLGRNDEARGILQSVIDCKGMPMWFRKHRAIARKALAGLGESQGSCNAAKGSARRSSGVRPDGGPKRKLG